MAGAGGGYVAYAKISLGKLADRVETFKEFVKEKKLDSFEEYADIIKRGEDMASGLNVFGISDFDKEMEEATDSCSKLADQLTELQNKSTAYHNLEEKLIFDPATEETIKQLQTELNEAIEKGDHTTAQAKLDELDKLVVKTKEDNSIYITSLIEPTRNYSNDDFAESDYNELYNAITVVENYVNQGDYVKAKEEALGLSVEISRLEDLAAMRKEAAAFEALYEKPEKLTVTLPIADGVDITQVVANLSNTLGIELELNGISFDDYGRSELETMRALGTLPDVMKIPADMYVEWAKNGVIADLTDYGENSELHNNGNFTGREIMQSLYIDGRLYGFTPERGQAVVTYIRKSWLDQLGLQVPTNYEELEYMLQAFTENAMGDTIDPKETFGMSAAGFINDGLYPWVYLQEFYQNVNPGFYRDGYGQWLDGFQQPEMQEAVARLCNVYQQGYLDPDICENSMMDAASNFASGKCGVITIMEGRGAEALEMALVTNGLEDDIIAINPLVEVGSYTRAVPMVYVVNANVTNPGGVMKYFFESMLDGAEQETAWMYGEKGVNWDNVAQDLIDEMGTTHSFTEGQFYTLPVSSTYITYTSWFLDPLYAMVKLSFGEGVLTEATKQSSLVAKQYSKQGELFDIGDAYIYHSDAIYQARQKALSRAIKDGEAWETVLADYQLEVGDYVNSVLDELMTLNEQ